MSQDQLTDQEKDTIKVYNQRAKVWSTKHSSPEFWQKELLAFKEFLPAGRILEIGSGAGRDAEHLLKMGYEYTGTDISDELLALARSKNPQATFLKMSVYELEFKEKFDGFWCAAVLLHIPKKRINEALRSILKNLNTGAVGFISLKEGEGERVKDDGRFFAYWQADEFKNILKNNGLEILKQGERIVEDKPILFYHVKLV